MEVIPLSTEEITVLRNKTKGTQHSIHFNNAGASLPPDVVIDTITAYLQEEAIYGGYETEAKYQAELDQTYDAIARLINADKDDIALVENASAAWGTAFNGIDFKPGDEIITCEMEYVTNLLGFINARQNHGVIIKIIPNNDQGNFSLSALEAAISSKTKLIAMTHIASTAGGMIPIVAIGKIAKKHDILYLVDACQSAGQLPVDVKEVGCDMLSVTGRKYLRAPRGTGFLFVKKSVQDKLKLMVIDGFSAPVVSLDDFTPRNDARRFELYEKNRALTLGLGKAIDYALNIGIDRIWQRVQYLAGLLRQKLGTMTGITVHDFGAEQCGIVTFSVDAVDSILVKNKLADKHINVSVGKAISTLIYMDKNHLASNVRASVHYYNTEEEISKLCEELAGLIGN
ncbi:aminotransferase class V-fold PLP-dependent enzyme [Mucilaginibacter flavus]|uniref:aminotransferase class V-fold PLP-dependent enzyme n=1 Tax=Mucilaginibacter flavus TaxID=931504 RepID=UPI0025B62451|nr:aminotransferase class V-fold PLP-dependent enzyme [Mucilaginibacter flavus]MDN3580487.1 aminotransferase class V-fold PLP-dependent enzyme [Mucilaginibacter flavus]